MPEVQAAGLEVGQTVAARLPAFPDRTVSGTLASILPENDQQSRTLRLRIELPNPNGQLRPGMTAQVSLDLTGQHDVLQIPSEAVVRTGKRNLVMLAEDQGRFRPVEVLLGQENDGWWPCCKVWTRPACGRLRAVPHRFGSKPERYRGAHGGRIKGADDDAACA